MDWLYIVVCLQLTVEGHLLHWFQLLWTFMYKCLGERKLLFLWDKFPDMQLLCHMIVVCSFKRKTDKRFSRVAVLFNIPISKVWVVQFLCILGSIWYYLFFFNFNSSDVQQYLILIDLKNSSPDNYKYRSPTYVPCGGKIPANLSDTLADRKSENFRPVMLHSISFFHSFTQIQ